MSAPGRQISLAWRTVSKVREASGGGTVVEVPADRVAGWFDRFGARHGGIAHTDLAAGRVAVLADDGASATPKPAATSTRIV